jgi:hypothetical protein
VNLHGGTVAARSEGVEKGTEFEVCLPAEADGAAGQAKPGECSSN